MSEVLEIEQQETERPERAVIRRTFAADMTPGEGRTVDARIVPFGVRITHNDGRGGVPKGVPYEEEWDGRAFDDQVRAAQSGRARHVLMNFEHEEGIRGIVGHGLMLRAESDALYGSFELHETPDGDKALTLIRKGVLGGISLEAYSKTSIRDQTTGLVKRVKAHLDSVALCRRPAYQDAVVLALREESDEQEVIIDADLLPLDLDPDLIERCQALGISLPERYKAHPAETGTLAEASTPEDGTRLNDKATESSEVENERP